MTLITFLIMSFDTWVLIFMKSKHRTILQPGNFTPRYILKRNENACPSRNSYTDVHSHVIHNCQEVEIIYVSIDGWVRKLWYIHTMDYCSAIKRNKGHVNPCYDLAALWKHYTEGQKPDTGVTWYVVPEHILTVRRSVVTRRREGKRAVTI